MNFFETNSRYYYYPRYFTRMWVVGIQMRKDQQPSISLAPGRHRGPNLPPWPKAAMSGARWVTAGA